MKSHYQETFSLQTTPKSSYERYTSFSPPNRTLKSFNQNVSSVQVRIMGLLYSFHIYISIYIHAIYILYTIYSLSLPKPGRRSSIVAILL